jgi:hypothetical protein
MHTCGWPSSTQRWRIAAAPNRACTSLLENAVLSTIKLGYTQPLESKTLHRDNKTGLLSKRQERPPQKLFARFALLLHHSIFDEVERGLHDRLREG